MLLILSLVVKMSMWPSIHADRLMLAIRRLELQLARRPAAAASGESGA